MLVLCAGGLCFDGCVQWLRRCIKWSLYSTELLCSQLFVVMHGLVCQLLTALSEIKTFIFRHSTVPLIVGCTCGLYSYYDQDVKSCFNLYEITSHSVIHTWLICPCKTYTLLVMMEAVCSFETSGPTSSVKQHNLTIEQNFWIKHVPCTIISENCWVCRQGVFISQVILCFSKYSNVYTFKIVCACQS